MQNSELTDMHTTTFIASCQKVVKDLENEAELDFGRYLVKSVCR